nr:hypothetical protein [Lachnospiraceae bacterium]
LLAGGPEGLAKKVLYCNTTEEAIKKMREEGFLSETMEVLAERIEEALDRHVYGKIATGVVFFSHQNAAGNDATEVKNRANEVQKGEDETGENTQDQTMITIGKNAERMLKDGLFCRGGIGRA